MSKSAMQCHLCWHLNLPILSKISCRRGIEVLTDRVSKERRSWNMSRIRSKNTTPEMRVRSELHRRGFRFRVNVKKLPGCPDIVLPKYRTVIFVHGCFWHRHAGCRYAYTPKTRTEFWDRKFRANKDRDESNTIRLVMSGWKTITIWECEIKKSHDLLCRIEEAIKQIKS